MKILVLSDSHGASFYMKKVIFMHKDAEAVFFLGDGVGEFLSLKDEFPSIAFIAVCGNCDIGMGTMYSLNISEQIMLCGKRIFACHGHTYQVKGGLGVLIEAARAREADIVLFGHTHKRTELYIPSDTDGGRSLNLVNPGSIGNRGGEGHSFAVVNIKENGVLVSFGSV